MIKYFTLVIFLTFSVFQTNPAQLQSEVELELSYSIDISDLSSQGATSIAVDRQSGHIYLGVDGIGFVELNPNGDVVNVFSIPEIEIDNSGMAIDLRTGNLIFVNGLGATNPEPIFSITTSGDIVSKSSSPIVEGAGLAIDTSSGNLFVVDANLRQGLQRIREVEFQESSYIEVNSFALPTILDLADAGIDVNPITGNLAISGVFGQNPGIIFDVSKDGSLIQEYVDTNLNRGISGLAFDDDPFRLYVLDGYGEQILIYEVLQKTYLPLVIRS